MDIPETPSLGKAERRAAAVQGSNKCIVQSIPEDPTEIDLRAAWLRRGDKGVNRLDQKVALVTGGASGLGRAIAQQLRLEGARVVITDIESKAGLATAAELDCEFLTQDVTSESNWQQVICHVVDRYHELHVLVNNAGILGAAVTPEDTQLADWQMVLNVNVTGVFLGCRAAIPAINSSGGGAIINMASIAGLLATPYATAYGVSKAAVRQLTKSIAQHCAQRKFKIRCNSLHPGVVRTTMWERHAEEEAQRRGTTLEVIIEEGRSRVPMGEFVEPIDIATAAVFLASDDSRHITGAKLVVDGGFIYCDTYR